jgi:hypothetical protein
MICNALFCAEVKSTNSIVQRERRSNSRILPASRDSCDASEFLLYSIANLKRNFLKKTETLEERKMKIAMRVTTYVAMLVAGVLLAESPGEPIPVPIPPTQVSQAILQGEPIPVPIPPASLDKV